MMQAGPDMLRKPIAALIPARKGQSKSAKRPVFTGAGCR
jgi:hypothetical protein